MLVIIEDADHGLVETAVRLRDRLVARLRSRSLDLALAAGAHPESTVALAVRAQLLTRPAMRDCLARSLERVRTEAARPGLRPSPLSLGRRRAVGAAADDLDALIGRLRGPGPVTARGIAHVVVLLGDAGGPLYTGATEPDLRSAVAQARTHLEDPVVVHPRPAPRR